MLKSQDSQNIASDEIETSRAAMFLQVLVDLWMTNEVMMSHFEWIKPYIPMYSSSVHVFNYTNLIRYAFQCCINMCFYCWLPYAGRLAGSIIYDLIDSMYNPFDWTLYRWALISLWKHSHNQWTGGELISKQHLIKYVFIYSLSCL